MRKPNKYFETKGIGESNDSSYPTAYHLALMDCGIEVMNIMTYSSILPKNATIIEKPNNNWFIENAGSVMECIMAVCNGKKDETLSAGICYNWLYNDNNEKVLGIVVEHHGCYSVDALRERLFNSIYELKNKSFSHYNWNEDEFKFIMNTFVPVEQFGCVISSICFIDYV